MLHCDRKEFDGLVEALAMACLRCRGPGGLLVQPNNNVMRLEAVASAMLTILLGTTVECEGVVHLSEFQIPRRP